MQLFRPESNLGVFFIALCLFHLFSAVTVTKPQKTVSCQKCLASE